MSRSEIFLLPPEDVEETRPLFERCPGKPYRFLQREIAPDLAAYWFDDVASALRDHQGQLFAAAQAGRLVGLAVSADLPWDSRVFGHRMGTIRAVLIDPDAPDPAEIIASLLDYVIHWAVDAGFDFLLCKTYTDDVRTIPALERRGFLLVDTLLDYVYDARRVPLHKVTRPPGAPGLSLRLAGSQDLDPLLAIARTSFGGHFGRYHADERLSRVQATQVYEEWVRSSLGGYADWVMVAEIDGRIAGYSIWKKPSPAEQQLGVKVGHYSIAATHPEYAGRGLFGQLTYAGMELLDGIADCIEGPTHINNYPVQRGYARLQWQIADARHSFHLWVR